MSNTKKSTNIALLGLFTALVVVLQLLSYVIKIGTFNLSLVLIPIVLAGVMYGPKYSSILGAVFGAVVVISSATGLDGGGFILFGSAPLLTTLVCMVKGIAAGFLSGAVANLLKDKSLNLAVFAAAAVAPIVNTGLFCISMATLFRDTLVEWAGGGDLLYYTVVGLVGINFLIEFAANLILSPSVINVSKALKRI